MIVLVFKFLIPKGFRGLTIYPFVFLSNRSDSQNKVLLNHEKIHIRQQLELLIIPFFIWYVTEYLIRILRYKNRIVAYRNISFEREAYCNEKDLNYVKSRYIWRFLKYL